MKRILESMLGIIGIIALVSYTLFLGVFLFVSVVLRFILPTAMARKLINPIIIEIALFWVSGILWWMTAVNRIDFDIEHDIELGMDQWNLIVSNHLSWVDIFALFYITKRKLPILKFFIKSQLIWVPVAGVAWWALDYPFMSRYSRDYLAKHPEKAGKDLETTRRACEKFSQQPTTIVNYLEGTRLTAAKHAKQQSPYRHLLKPKSGGIAFAIQALGEKFNTLIDTTVYYPGGAPNYWDLACGRTEKIVMRLRKLEIPAQFRSMDYTHNPEHKAEFQGWVNTLWQEKDDLLEQLHQQYSK